MIMSTVIIASAASVQAYIAAQQAHEAMRISCEALMPAFKHDGATVAQIHQYAECADLVYHEPISDGSLAGIKVLIAIMFIGIAAGAWIGGRSSRGFDFAEGLLGAFVVGILLPAIALILYLLYRAALFLIA
jgi:predicted MFS family arabinose efflux permease